MLDDAQTQRAQAEGWKLVTTFENGSSHPVWDIACHGERFVSDHAAKLAVIDAAKRGGVLHQTALALVFSSRAPAQPTKRTKK